MLKLALPYMIFAAIIRRNVWSLAHETKSKIYKQKSTQAC